MGAADVLQAYTHMLQPPSLHFGLCCIGSIVLQDGVHSVTVTCTVMGSSRMHKGSTVWQHRVVPGHVRKHA